MTRWSAITRTRRSRSALAYGSRSTAAAETTSTGSYTTSGDATRLTTDDQLIYVAEGRCVGFRDGRDLSTCLRDAVRFRGAVYTATRTGLRIRRLAAAGKALIYRGRVRQAVAVAAIKGIPPARAIVLPSLP